MEIRALNIESHKHLQNLRFDFTYPRGHRKFGQPLKKICIVGQSATGKTTILEIVRDTIVRLRDVEIMNGKYLYRHVPGFSKGDAEFALKEGLIKVSESSIIKDGKVFESLPGSGSGSITNLIEDTVKILYFGAEILMIEIIKILNQNPVEISAKLSENDSNNRRWHDRSGYVYEFGLETDDDAKWLTLLTDILDYRKRFTQFASELISRGILADVELLNKEYLNWAKDNVNPLALFADYANPVLNKLNLEVDLINTEYIIPIKSKKDNGVIPFKGLSTGTKGLLLSMFPLFELDTDQGIILIDEPERSLFPDMQIDLLEHYLKLAPNAQFLVATHSPFIAASFEPEERFILYFDGEGKVAVRQGQSPIGDDPNDILRNDFNVEYYNKFGKDAYKRYVDLKRQVAQETEPYKKKELIKKMAALGDKYNFDEKSN